jgi:hypothetical protein
VTEVVLAIALGLAAGIASGLFGVGGGILFVPTLVFLGLDQLDAEATSLLAIIPTVAVGAWRQQRYGNLRWRVGVAVGLASVPGVALGIWLAESLGHGLLRVLFALLMLGMAGQIAWRAGPR